MLHKVFAVYDSKIESYLPPFFTQSKGAALRAFTEAVNDPSHNFHKYASDFTLFELGSFDDQICQFDLLAAKVSIGTALEFKDVVNS